MCFLLIKQEGAKKTGNSTCISLPQQHAILQGKWGSTAVPFQIWLLKTCCSMVEE